MAGVRGRSGGANRKSLAELQRSGTYRADRHRHLLTTATSGSSALSLVLSPTTEPSDWRPTTVERAELGPRALDWLDTAVSAYQWEPLEGRRLLEALRGLTRIEALETAIKAEGVSVDGGPHPLLVALAREVRLFQSAWQGLRLEG